MPIMEKIEKYSVWMSQNNYLGYDRAIRLHLESGHTAYIGFPVTRPQDWLQFVDGDTNLFMPLEEYDGVYHLLQSEAPVYFTALNLLGLQVGAVHTELDLSAGGEPPGEGEHDPQSLEALIRLALARQDEAAPTASPA